MSNRAHRRARASGDTEVAIVTAVGPRTSWDRRRSRMSPKKRASSRRPFRPRGWFFSRRRRPLAAMASKTSARVRSFPRGLELALTSQPTSGVHGYLREGDPGGLRRSIPARRFNVSTIGAATLIDDSYKCESAVDEVGLRRLAELRGRSENVASSAPCGAGRLRRSGIRRGRRLCANAVRFLIGIGDCAKRYRPTLDRHHRGVPRATRRADPAMTAFW